MTAEQAPGSVPDEDAALPPAAPGLRGVLNSMIEGDPAERVQVRDMISDLGRGTFGVPLFLAALPAFIPIPGLAGALSGPLTIMVGLQLLLLLRKPWLPGFLANRGPKRESVLGAERKLTPWLKRLEKLVRPRKQWIVDHPLAVVFTGLQIVLLGVLLSLPIPGTNYLFALILMVYALALLEGDGLLMLGAWAMGLIAIVVIGALSGNVIALTWAWLERMG